MGKTQTRKLGAWGSPPGAEKTKPASSDGGKPSSNKKDRFTLITGKISPRNTEIE